MRGKSRSSDRGAATAGAFVRWWGRGLCGVVRDGARYWYLTGPVVLIWVLAVTRVAIHHQPVTPLLFNWSPSLPYHVAIAHYGARNLARGDFIVYSFLGAAAAEYGGLRGQPLFKRIAGIAGDTVTVTDRYVYVNGHFVGWAKPHTFDKRPLNPITPTVIPAGYVYVQGTHHDSFDSRYQQSGLVKLDAVVAKLTPLF